MDCAKFNQLLADYTHLSAEEHAALAEHAETCDECAKELEGYRAMLEAVSSLPKLKAPDDFLAKLNERIDKEETKVVKNTSVWLYLRQYGYRYSAIASCLALIAIIGTNANVLNQQIRGTNSDLPGGISLEDAYTPREMPFVSMPSGTAAPTGSPAPSGMPMTSAAPTARTPAARSATQKPLATAIPSHAQKKATTPTLSPKITAKPAEHTQAPEENQTEAPAAENTAAPEITAAPASQTPTTSETDAPIAVNNLLDPNAYTLPENSDSKSVNVGSSDYSRSADASNSIEVSSANAERAKEIINEYSIGNNGDYYSVSTDKMEEFLQAMSNAGIEFDENCVMDSDTVTFKLIIS